MIHYSHIIHTLLSVSSLLLCSTAITDTITQNQVIHDGETIVSGGKKFELGFFTPDGVYKHDKRYVGIWYYGLSQNSTTVVWVANKGKPLPNSNGSITIRDDGNLTILDGLGNIFWNSGDFYSSPLMTTTTSSAQLYDSGNLILMGVNDAQELARSLWESFLEDSNTHLPDMVDMSFGKVLRSWNNEHDPSPGPFTFHLDIQSTRYIIKNGSNIYWRSRSNTDFANSSEIPPNSVDTILSNLTDYLAFNNMRLVMNQSGQIRFYDNRSDLILFAPTDNCSIYNACGPYGICNSSTTNLLCKCLTGFKPVSLANWDSGQFSAGCTSKLSSPGCKYDSGFFPLNVIKVENTNTTFETSNYFKEAKDMEQFCRLECLKQCKCNAFSVQKGNGTYGGCKLWISNDLRDLQEAVSKEGQDIYFRVASSNMEPTCNSSTDCEAWPYSVCEERTSSNTTEIGKKRCICSANHQWDPSKGNCTITSTQGGSGLSSNKISTALIVVITIAAIVIFFFGIFCWRIIMRRRMVSKRKAYRKSNQEISAFPFDEDSEHARDPNKFGKDEKGIDVPFFDFEIIVAATNDFSNLNKLGRGGFGPVYKGKLMGGQEIAVKRLSRSSGQGLAEFKNEVLLIAKLQHRNLVRLVGYSVQGDEKILLYEYMPNKSLDSFIFDQSRCSLLNWEKRFNIILGIARGLLYLHQDSRLRIIHRDLKTSNILLDEEMNPKISDFGLARIFGGNQSAENTNRVVGTYGYMSPEYALDGIFSAKSDVFSFGIVLLEIISGKKTAGFQSEHSLSLLGYAWELWKKDKVLDFMDKSLLCESYNEFEVSKCFHIGLLCVQEDADDRPTMSNVVSMLGSETATLPTPKEPAFIAKKYCPSSRPEIYSINELTITEEQGR
ncbi:G-type lectin S-receptor-like serine/threonine-protein kinase At4g03230 [Telopea speciosissima]|uniref:G-type lectin S-receptor-like serine/threonine-protein kinase At4g03230 n=1 Tax=Telopea speciosissima TaxID=54955 RepID=UPI001CC6FF65|nr:G-type lectin S-receptor-like serine/threonine-protein kinase At4g03230 [Telopea speciosissima]